MRPARPTRAGAKLTVVPELPAEPAPLSDSELEAQVAAEIAAEVEAELAASLNQEIAAAESLVEQLDRDLHGGVAVHYIEEATDSELVMAARTGDEAALAGLLTK